jgi:hypothetical protein
MYIFFSSVVFLISFLQLLDTFFKDRNFAKLIWFLFIHTICSAVDMKYINVDYNVLMNLNPETIDHDYENSLLPVAQIALATWTSALIECTIMTKGKKEMDLMQMIIHHGVTITLILLSIIFDFKAFAVVVLAVHDISDVFVIICKITARMKFLDIFLVPSYLSMLASWIYYRFYLFGYLFLYQKLSSVFFTTSHVGRICTIFLSSLLCLHVYWFILMLKLALKKDRVKQFEEA